MIQNKKYVAMSLAVALAVVLTTLSLQFNEASADGLQYTFRWVKRVDTIKGSPIADIMLSGSSDWQSSKARAFILTTRPEVIVINLKDQTIPFTSGRIRLPALPPSGLRIADGALDDEKYFAWITTGGTPTLHIYRTKDDARLDITLTYIADPRPTTVALAQSGKYVLVGDEAGYVALYEKTGGGD